MKYQPIVVKLKSITPVPVGFQIRMQVVGGPESCVGRDVFLILDQCQAASLVATLYEKQRL